MMPYHDPEPESPRKPWQKPTVERVPLTPPAAPGLCHDEPDPYADQWDAMLARHPEDMMTDLAVTYADEAADLEDRAHEAAWEQAAATIERLRRRCAELEASIQRAEQERNSYDERCSAMEEWGDGQKARADAAEALLAIRCTVTDKAALGAIPVAAAHKYLREHGWFAMPLPPNCPGDSPLHFGTWYGPTADGPWQVPVTRDDTVEDRTDRMFDLLAAVSQRESRSQLAVLADLQELAKTTEVSDAPDGP